MSICFSWIIINIISSNSGGSRNLAQEGQPRTISSRTTKILKLMITKVDIVRVEP